MLVFIWSIVKYWLYAIDISHVLRNTHTRPDVTEVKPLLPSPSSFLPNPSHTAVCVMEMKMLPFPLMQKSQPVLFKSRWGKKKVLDEFNVSTRLTAHCCGIEISRAWNDAEEEKKCGENGPVLLQSLMLHVENNRCFFQGGKISRARKKKNHKINFSLHFISFT